MKINRVYINAIKRLYANCQSCVKIGANSSLAFKINKGLRQGCCITQLNFFFIIIIIYYYYYYPLQNLKKKLQPYLRKWRLSIFENAEILATFHRKR